MSSSSLPPLYNAWLEPLIGAFPKEGRATCSDCAMCDKADRHAVAAYAFQPDIKCCVYQPDLPNFSVGRILSDPTVDPTSIEKRLHARIGVTPWGLRAPPAYKLLHKQSANAIGRSTELRCPHFVVESGSCGIHAHRNHLCSSWFCKHERGLVGYQFWRSIHALLHAIEEELARWCAVELELAPAALTLLKPKSEDDPTDTTEIEGQLSDNIYAAFWANWAGRERAFYAACAEKVSHLNSAQLMDICGPTVRVNLAIAQAAWKQLQSKELPENLRCGSYQLLSVQEGGLAAITYSSTDPVGIPDPLLPLLHYFDGRPTQDIRQQILTERGIDIQEGLLQTMVDWGVLQ